MLTLHLLTTGLPQSTARWLSGDPAKAELSSDPVWQFLLPFSVPPAQGGGGLSSTPAHLPPPCCSPSAPPSPAGWSPRALSLCSPTCIPCPSSPWGFAFTFLSKRSPWLPRPRSSPQLLQPHSTPAPTQAPLFHRTLRASPLLHPSLLLPAPFPTSFPCSQAQPLSFLGAESLPGGCKVLRQLPEGDKWFVDNESKEAVFKAA